LQPKLATIATAEAPGITAPGIGSRADAKIWTKVLSFPVFLAVALAACVFLFDSGSISDPDIWWHLRNAEVLVKNHAVVQHDFYSFTAHGSRWINESWLGELPYYAGWRWFGIRGIYLVMLAEIELVLLGVFGLAWLRSRNVKASFVACSLAVWLATVSFGPRTLLAGWICLVAELLLLELFREGRDWLWCLVPLFVLWANLHGSWLIGIVLFFVYCACGLVEGTWGRIEASRWNRAQLCKLITVAALSVAALFVNPYGFHLVTYPFEFAFQQKLNVGRVEEWASLDFHTPRGKVFFVVLAAILVSALARKCRWRLDEVAFLLIALYAALSYSRFLFLAGIILTPLLARELDFFPAYDGHADKPWLNAILTLVILAGCCMRLPSEELLWRDTVRNYPVKALPYLKTLHAGSRVFNDYLWGGYLIWNVRDLPVFVDSRVDIFEYNGVFGDYLDVLDMKNALATLKKYDIRYVLFRRRSPLAYLLSNTSGWQQTYGDDTAVFFERKEEPLRPAIRAP
jgi:hypothetical protein